MISVGKESAVEHIRARRSLDVVRMQIVKMIATIGPISRVLLSEKTGLSKMTISNYVSELISQGIVSEVEISGISPHGKGRRPTGLTISPSSPLICGILIKRGVCQAISADLSGRILNSVHHGYPEHMTEKELIAIILGLIDSLAAKSPRPFVACGVASIGPLNVRTGSLLSPPNFYQIKNLNIIDEIQKHTNVPALLINDATAGALSELLYGYGKSNSHFAYLHIMNGIGMGFVINGEIYNHISGQNGEIGHVSINFNGPLCPCGNRGCLELYANQTAMWQRIQELSHYFPKSPLSRKTEPGFAEILEAAAKNDPIALNVLDSFLEYVTIALISTINLLDFPMLIIGYDCSYPTDIVEKIIMNKTNSRLVALQRDKLAVYRSTFQGDAPLIGSSAVIASEIFKGNIPL